MRFLGALNIMYVAFGAYLSYWMIRLHWNRWPGNPSHYEWAIFVFLSAISISMVLYLGYLGIRLIKKDAKALLKLSLLFVVELLYSFVLFYVTWIVRPTLMSMTVAVSFMGMADVPLWPQLLTGYPLIGLVVTLILSLIRQKSEKIL
jgi:hypothetical protein